MTGLIIVIIILSLVLMASGWFAYGVTLNLLNQRKLEREQFKKAIELIEVRAAERIRDLTAERDDAFARGKQEGKRTVLDWIKTNVDDGTLEVKVVGSPQ